MSELVVRKSIQEIYLIKLDVLVAYKELDKQDRKITALMEQVNNYAFHRLDYKCDYHGENREEKEVDKRIWFYLMKFYNLEKYMLCTEYDKLEKQVGDYQFPVFNPDNVNAWLAALKKTVYENIQKLIEDVFNRITNDTYWTGSGYSSRKNKKRNNNGISKHFIITTNDNYALSWYSNKPTITDDLEKACYIIDGKSVPDITIKQSMHQGKIWESENPYFKIRICHNGNTHYWIKDEIRNKLNLYGAGKGIIGEDIKIKVFEKPY